MCAWDESTRWYWFHRIRCSRWIRGEFLQRLSASGFDSSSRTSALIEFRLFLIPASPSFFDLNVSHSAAFRSNVALPRQEPKMRTTSLLLQNDDSFFHRTTASSAVRQTKPVNVFMCWFCFRVTTGGVVVSCSATV